MFRINEEPQAHMKRAMNEFIASSRANGRFVSFEYARGPREWAGCFNESGDMVWGRGAPEGAFFVWEDEGGNLHFGWSLRNNKNEPRPFSRVEAVYRAFQRSGEALTSDSINRVPSRQRMNYVFFIDASREEREFWHAKQASRDVVPEAVA